MSWRQGGRSGIDLSPFGTGGVCVRECVKGLGFSELQEVPDLQDTYYAVP